MKLEDFKEIIAVNPKAKFKFDLGRSCYSFSQYPDVTGVITFDSWGNDSVIWADVAGYDDLLSFNVREIELHKESSEDIETKKLKFPCCVPTSQIEDEATLNKLIDLFVANGAKRYDFEYHRLNRWNYFGVSTYDDSTTQYYDGIGTYSNDAITESDVTIYSVEELLSPAVVVEPTLRGTPWIVWSGGEKEPTNLPAHAEFKFRNGEIENHEAPYYFRWEHYNERDIVAYREYKPSVASQEAITDVSNSKPSVGIDFGDSGYKEPTEPLVSITKEVKYTVTIKGVDFTFTQDQLNELVSELEGYRCYE